MNSVTAIRFQNILRYINTLEDKPICTFLSVQRMSCQKNPLKPRVCPVSSSTNFCQSKRVDTGGIPPASPEQNTPNTTPQKRHGQQQTAPWVCTSTSHTWHR